MLTGGCQCGEIRYESEREPLALYICHCHECQKQSASAFGISLDVLSTGFRLTHGAPRYWNRCTARGQILKCAFCSSCGSRCWHESSSTPDRLSLKVGSLDESIDVSNAIHVWVSRKLPGIIIPMNCRQFAEED